MFTVRHCVRCGDPFRGHHGYRVRFCSLACSLLGHVQVGAPDACWLGLREDGTAFTDYGDLSFRGRKYQIHRLSLSFKEGRMLHPSEWALHSCDNPPCCNPAHLRVGTAADNNAECWARGRNHRNPLPVPAGERHGMSILSEEDVRSIRARFDAGESAAAIAVDWTMVDRRNVWAICKRKTWRHVA